MAPTTYLTGKILIAMPRMEDANFGRSLVYVCNHTEQGAMGLIINKPAPLMSLADLLDETRIVVKDKDAVGEILATTVRLGGPVEQFRGFVLHSTDHPGDETSLKVGTEYALSVALNVLRDLAHGKGPRHALVALGYSGWSPGQLENEMQRNGWLFCEPDVDLLFGPNLETKYDRALAKIGVDKRMLSGDVGHA